MSELRVVLLGNSWSERSSVGNFILGETKFNTEEEPDRCLRERGWLKEKEIVLINTPDLLHPNISEYKLTEHVTDCVSLSAPGPHVFLLVLQREYFTEKQKLSLCRVLKLFSDRSFDQSLVLISTQRTERPALMGKRMQHPLLTEMIGMCRYGCLNVKNLEHSELLTRFGQIIKGNNGEHVICDVYEDKVSAVSGNHQNLHQQEKNTSDLGSVGALDWKASTGWVKRNTHSSSLAESTIKQQSTLRTVPLGKSADNKTKLGNFLLRGDGKKQSPESLRIVLIGKTGCGKSSTGNTILGKKKFKAESSQKSVTQHCKKEQSEVHGRLVVVVDTPGLFDTSLPQEKVKKEMVKCISLLAPGPHVFLLVLQIGRFTEEEKETLKLIKEGFGKNSEKFTFILLTGGDKLKHDKLSIEEYIEHKCDDSFKELLSDCGGRYHVFDNYSKQIHKQVSELITKIDTMVKENGGSCYTNEMLQEAEADIQKEMERILKEKEEELKREREELQRKHEEEMEAMKRRMQEQRAETEKERKLREKELKEKEGKIKKEREERKKEQEMREEEDRKRKQQEEIQRQWERKVEALEQKIRSESESKEIINRQLEESREEMRKERENWEKKQNEWWDQRYEEEAQRRQEEQTRLRKLQEEKENYEKKKEEEDRIRREQEETKRKDLEKKFYDDMENLKRTFDREARRNAEEHNEYKPSNSVYCSIS